MKKKGERAREESSGELTVMATMVTVTPARTRTANSPSLWLAWPCYYIEEVERKMAKLIVSWRRQWCYSEGARRWQSSVVARW